MPEEVAKGAVQPTLFIGLGGTGKEILLRMRRRFYERWRVTGFPCMAYLWMDTDVRDVWAQGEKIDEIDLELRFEEHEKVTLLEGNVGTDLGVVLKNKNKFEYIHKWLHPEVEQFGTQIGNGAGAVRSIGRLTFFSKFTSVKNRLETALNRITAMPAILETKGKYLPGVEFSNTPQVYLIFSVAGGTGGGTFLDVAFLLQKLGLRNVTGIMLLPNVYFPIAGDETAKRSYGNAYSALKELEFFTRRIRPLTTHGDDTGLSIDFDVDWTGSGTERIPGPPFKVLHVCEARNEENIGVGNKTELFHMLAETLFLDFLPGPFSTQKRSRLADIFQYMASVQDAYMPVAGTTMHQSFSRRYATLGMSKIEVPLESIREACSSRLAAEIVEHWNRQPTDPNLKGALEAQKRARFDAEGIEALFDEEASWKKTIDEEMGKRFSDLPSEGGQGGTTLEEVVTALPQKLRELDEKIVAAAGKDPTRWGIATSSIRNSTGKASEKFRQKLTEWLAGCLDKEEWGINALLGDAGFIALLRAELRRLYQDAQNESVTRRDQALADATYWQQRRDLAAAEMNYALRSIWLKLLGMRTWTLQTLLGRVREAAEQHAKALAASYVAEEMAKVAKAGDEFLGNQETSLRAFQKMLGSLSGHFSGLEKNFLEIGETFLSIRVFNPQKDFPKFYLLEFDEHSGKHKTVVAAKEHVFFLEAALGANKRTFDLVRQFERDGEDWVRSRLRSFTTERFRRDFEECRNKPEKHRECGRFVEVLKHPEIQESGAKIKDTYTRFVLGALPLLRRSVKISGLDEQRTVKKVYLGVAATDREPYSSFIKEVRNLLAAHDYPEPAIHLTDDPTVVRLFIETYAFPLPTVDLVVGDCHESYYDFYHGIRRNPREQRHKIPSHLCSNWEGQFDDLKQLEEKDAKLAYEALEVLSLGPVVGVIRVLPRDHRREYAYKRWVAPAAQQEELGNRREAIEYLQRNEQRRKELLQQIAQREEELKKGATGSDPLLLKYYWALCYLRLAVFSPGTTEYAIVEKKLEDIEGTCKAHNLEVEDLSERIPQQQIARCKEMLGQEVEWIGDFPVLQKMTAFVLGKS